MKTLRGLRSWDVQSAVLFKDKNIVALNKPSGLSVHPGPRVKNHVLEYLETLKNEFGERPQLIHRLDKDTSGILLLSTHKKAARLFAQYFHDGFVKKTYWAIAVGRPELCQGRVVAPIQYLPTRKGYYRLSVVRHRKGQKMSVTDYRQLAFSSDCCLLELSPITGHKHQLRVHASQILRCPIVGDSKYGSAPVTSRQTPLHLHAKQITVKNYYGMGRDLIVTAPLPNYFTNTILREGLYN